MTNRYFKATEISQIQTIVPVNFSSGFANGYYFIKTFDMLDEVINQFLAIDGAVEIDEAEFMLNMMP